LKGEVIMCRTTPSFITFLFVFVVAICAVVALTSCVVGTTPVPPESQSPAPTGAPVAPAVENSFVLLSTEDIRELKLTDSLTDTFVLLPAVNLPDTLGAAIDSAATTTTTLVLAPASIFTNSAEIPQEAFLVVSEDKLSTLSSAELDARKEGVLQLQQPIPLSQTDILLLQPDEESLESLAAVGEPQELVVDVIGSNIEMQLRCDPCDESDSPPVPCGCQFLWWCPCITEPSGMLPRGAQHCSI
jgi:hypothetical protein